jgi:hypothetical protein
MLSQISSTSCNRSGRLSSKSGRMGWPQRGVYFFRETGEQRTDSGSGPRIVRVGTHALASGSCTTLWKRLSQHKGVTKSGGGNHRGSIFRLIMGTALAKTHGYSEGTWGQDNTASADIRKNEVALEKEVSAVIGKMPFIWLGIHDDPGPTSLRGYIERNAISLLSNFGKAPIDAPSDDWLGHACNRIKVRKSGLWNQNHVDQGHQPAFLDALEGLILQVAATE